MTRCMLLAAAAVYLAGCCTDESGIPELERTRTCVEDCQAYAAQCADGWDDSCGSSCQYYVDQNEFTQECVDEADRYFACRGAGDVCTAADRCVTEWAAHLGCWNAWCEANPDQCDSEGFPEPYPRP